jgi:uncharacterized protein (TIGR02284 family)
MDTEKTIDVLNKLLEINNDRIEGYETASKETSDHELKTLFAQFARTSNRCRQELREEIIRLGGTPTDDTRMTGKFFRAWMDVKAAFTGNDRKTIFNSCEFGEDHAVETYEDVMENDYEHLTIQQQSHVSQQYAAIKADHDTVKSMRDALVAAS